MNRASVKKKKLSKKEGRSFRDFLFIISFSISDSNFCEFRPFFCDRGKLLPLNSGYFNQSFFFFPMKNLVEKLSLYTIISGFTWGFSATW